MTDWNPKANEIFLEALELSDPDARREFVARKCAGDELLRRAVEVLLSDAANVGSSFLAQPAAKEVRQLNDDSPETQLPRGSLDVAPESELGTTCESSPITNMPSTMISPYKLLQRIGEGGMGEVWMAEQEKPVRRRAAVKLIKAGLDSKQVIARFEAERQALAMMDHQNIAKVLDAGTWHPEKGVRTLYRHHRNVSCVAFGPDGTRIYSVDFGNTRIVWDSATGQPIPNASWPETRPYQPISPDHRWMVVHSGKRVLLVDLEYKNTPDEKAYREFKSAAGSRMAHGAG